MAEFDTVIRNGMIVDASRLPRARDDMGIKDGRIAKIGRLKDHEGAKVIDAGGLIVAPGFVDLHTHYDAQLFWDPHCSISCWHGVTSVVIGNCGFGFAPVKPEFRERSMLTMTRNEAIPLESGEWGLEDYAVELKGSYELNFECLHYQLVGKVMKEDDEVMYVLPLPGATRSG